MPPALHPRSSHTLTLFTSTLALSFLVVGLPHLVPCPVKPQAYADGAEGAPRQRRRRTIEGDIEDIDDRDAELIMRDIVQEQQKKRRACPVPKPSGLVGHVLGFKPSDEGAKPVIKVQRLDSRSRRIVGEEADGNG